MVGFFFFKQKTAYELRISDWSSDVCSSDLILAALSGDPSEWAAKELRTIATKSPTSCKVALRLLAHGAEMRDFADEMRREYAIAVHLAQGHDFAEGVRALLIDKDNAPHWRPATPGDEIGRAHV